MKLRELCTIQSGGTPSRSKPEFWENGSIPWVKISDFDGKYVSHTEEKITECGLLSSSAKVFPKGTLLYTIFATLGEVCILDIDAATNQAIAGITIKNDNVDEDYLFYFLTSLKTYVNRIGRGVAQNNINMSILREIEVPLPSIVRQKRIADILGKADQLIEKKERQLITLDELVKSRFVEMFGDPISHLDRGETKQLDRIAERITVGFVGEASNDYVEAGVPYLRTQNVRVNHIDLEGLIYVNESFHKKNSKSIIRPGDIVISRVGANRGMAAVIPESLPEANIANCLIVGRTNLIDSCYLAFYLNMSYGKRPQFGASVGSAQGVVNTSVLKKWEIYVPEKKEQKEFVEYVNQVDKSKQATVN